MNFLKEIYRVLLSEITNSLPFSKSWLSNCLDEKLLKANKNQRKEIFIENAQNFMLSGNSWIWVVPSIVILFILCFQTKIHMPMLFKIDKKLGDLLIDQRIGNIATIFSVSMVVIGFLINNIAEKSKDNYIVLFRGSYLFPYLYFVLSTIFSLVIFSYWRDTPFITETTYINSIILGLYLILIMLIFIAVIFNQIKKFTNPDYLLKSQQKKILRKVSIIIYNNINEFKSKEIYNSSLSTFEKDSFNPFMVNRLDFYIIKNNRKQNGSLKDINLESLKNTLTNLKPSDNNKPIRISCNQLWLSKSINANEPFIWIDKNAILNNRIKRKLEKCFIVKNKIKEDISYEELINSLKEKLLIAVEDNNKEMYKHIMETYEKVYDMYMDSLKLYK